MVHAHDLLECGLVPRPQRLQEPGFLQEREATTPRVSSLPSRPGYIASARVTKLSLMRSAGTSAVRSRPDHDPVAEYAAGHAREHEHAVPTPVRGLTRYQEMIEHLECADRTKVYVEVKGSE